MVGVGGSDEKVDIVEGDDREKRGCRNGKRERAEGEAGLTR